MPKKKIEPPKSKRPVKPTRPPVTPEGNRQRLTPFPRQARDYQAQAPAARPVPRRVPGPPVLDPSSGVPMKKGRPVENWIDQRPDFFDPLPDQRRRIAGETLDTFMNTTPEQHVNTALGYYKEKLAPRSKAGVTKSPRAPVVNPQSPAQKTRRVDQLFARENAKMKRK